VQSRAPEYSGSVELTPVKDAETLAAVAGEPLPSASASASAAPPPSAAPVAVPRLPGTPDLTKDGLYLFTGGGIELLVDPHSGSVVRLSLDGKSALVQPETSPDNYAAELEGSTLILKGAAGGLTKRYRLDTARRSVEVTYTLENTTTKPFHASSTDFHRVPSSGGLTFFPGAQKLLPGSTLKLNVWQPVVWFPHDQIRDTATVEASVDSTEGWVASLNDGLLLVKVFGDAPRPTIVIASAYDPATKQRPWVEIGARSSFELLPGASATSNVRLFLRKLPTSIAAKPGNQELVGFVRGVIQ
jgi:hypothetical protein